MRKRLSLLCIIFILAMPIVNAQKEEIGLYLLNLGKFDVATGSFTADFYLSIKCEKKCSTNFEFMNGRASSIDGVIDLPNEKFYRIQANLNSKVDLRSFPFDEQRMEIIIEDKINTLEKLQYVPIRSESGIDDSIAFTGWNIDSWDAVTREHEYGVYGEKYSQYVFSVDISRIAFNSFLKTFLPVLVIVLIVLLTFLMDPDKVTQRLTLNSSSLIAAVMFHISISNQIPPVGYLTFADRFMILTYFVLLASIIITIILLELHELKKTELAEKIHRSTEYSAFVIVPLLYILFFMVFA